MRRTIVKRAWSARLRYVLGWPKMIGRWFTLAWWRSRTRRQRLLAAGLALLTIVGVVAPLLVFRPKAEAAWWNGSWTYRRKVVFNNAPSASNLTNFPVLVSLNSVNVDYSNTQNSGQDIRFIDSDGTTVLSHEIENWNESGSSEVWVKIPQIDAGTTTDFIWMYYGNAGAGDGQAVTSVWSNGYQAVYHSEESSGTGIADSTSNANNATKKTSTAPLATATGVIGRAQNYNLSYVRAPDTNSLDVTTAGTVSAWVKRSTTLSLESVMSKGTANTDPSQNYALEIQNSNDKMAFIIGNGTTGNNLISNTPMRSTSQSYFVNGTWDGTTMKFYLNGQLDGSRSQTITPTANTGNLGIGEYSINNDHFDGIIDEVRVSNAARTADWVQAEYRAGRNTMLTYGQQETQTSGRDAWCSDSTGGVTCDGNWTARRPVTLLNGGSAGNLASFPVLVVLNSTNINYSKTQNSGQDIRFVDPTNPSLALPHQIESWNEAGNSYVWVQVPQIDAASNADFLWMYYGNAVASDGQDSTNVWDSNFKAVYHMNDDPTTVNCVTSKNICDSTANANNGTSNGSMTAGDLVAGQAGGAINLDGSNDFLQVPNSTSIQSSANMTYSLWMNWAGTSGDPTVTYIFDKGSSDTSDSYSMFLDFGANDNIGFEFNDSAGALRAYKEPDGNVDIGKWVQVTLVFDDANNILRYYYNGEQFYSTTVSQSLNTTFNNSLFIGKQNFTGNNAYFAGKLDEFRIAGTARSADWVLGEYLSSSNQMVTMGAEETYLPPPTLTAFGGATSTTPMFQLRGSDPVSPSYLRYKIDVCSTSNCSSIVRTIDQTASQTGWSGQDTQTSTAYVASSTLGSSTLASHTYQAAALSQGTNYWWRGYSIDPSGDNMWSEASAISSFTTTSQNIPASPTLINPASSATGVSTTPAFTLRTTDADNDYLRYKIDVCSTSNCSSIVRTIDQTASQTGWSGQDTQTSTAYVGNVTLASSTIATHTYQAAALTPGTQYWWRAAAIDPGGSNIWSTVSSIRTFTTAVTQSAPAVPTLINPIGGAGTSDQPTFQLRTTDANGDYLRYKIEVCSVSNCGTIVRTIDQTASQTGWSGQDTQTSTAYVGSSSLGSSTIATHAYQPTLLSLSTQYWWRAYAIDPAGSNTFSGVSAIGTFTTNVLPPSIDVQVKGGANLRGGSNVGN